MTHEADRQLLNLISGTANVDELRIARRIGEALQAGIGSLRIFTGEVLGPKSPIGIDRAPAGRRKPGARNSRLSGLRVVSEAVTFITMSGPEALAHVE